MKRLIFLILVFVILISPYLVEAPPPPRVCGDGQCQDPETCSDCPEDCGECAGDGNDNTASQPGAGVSVQKIIRIYPQYPLDEETLKNGNYKFSVKLLYGESTLSSADVIANSSLFGEVGLSYTSGITGIYEGDIIIKNKEKGRYRITYMAEDKVKEESSFFVNLDPELKILMDLNKDYSKGERIEFEGEVKDFKNELQKNVNLTVKGFSQGQLFERDVVTDNNGRFNIDYLISYADPAGIWDVVIEAEDEYGNLGDIKFNPEITTRGIANYAVNFLSPLIDSEFKRGDSIPITVEIKEKNNLIENANVVFFSPIGESLELNEVDKGVYSGNYIIRNDDPVGDVRLKVVVIKEVKEDIIKTGGDSIPIKISPVEMNFEVLSPLSDIVYTNSRVEFSVELTYKDGSLVEGGNVKAVLSNDEVINLLETKKGVYFGSYFVTEEDLGTLDAEIVAEDISENIGSIKIHYYVRQRGYIGNLLGLFSERVVRPYWWVFLVVFVLLGLIYKKPLEIKYLNNGLSRAKKEQKSIRNMQVETEKKYYKERSINKTEFNQLKQEYEQRASNLNEKESNLKGRLKKLKNK